MSASQWFACSTRSSSKLRRGRSQVRIGICQPEQVRFQLGNSEIAGVQRVDAAPADQATHDQRVPFKPGERPQTRQTPGWREPATIREGSWTPADGGPQALAYGLDDVLTNMCGHMTTKSGRIKGAHAHDNDIVAGP